MLWLQPKRLSFEFLDGPSNPRAIGSKDPAAVTGRMVPNPGCFQEGLAPVHGASAEQAGHCGSEWAATGRQEEQCCHKDQRARYSAYGEALV